MESSKRPAEGMADLEMPWRNHPPLDRRPPGKFAIGQMHGKHAAPIARQNGAGGQIATDRNHILGPGCPRVRKPEGTGRRFDRQAFILQQVPRRYPCSGASGAGSGREGGGCPANWSGRGGSPANWAEGEGPPPIGRKGRVPRQLVASRIDQGGTIATHEVLNQPPPLEAYDLAAAEPILIPSLESNAADWAVETVTAFGLQMASPEVYEWGFLANRHSPELRTHDRYGNRIDTVEFHSSWHRLLGQSIGHGLHSLPWEPSRPKAGHLVRAALTFLASQIEAGHFCPISMTYAVLPALGHQPEVAAAWEPKVLSRAYDPTFRPAPEKSGLLIGMGMTEKQGGSDVRAGTTRAEAADDGYLITGHKWFMSAPMSDAFLILAQAPAGLTCFLLPRFRPDGAVNEIRIQRLKDKLGNRSNASAEVEFDRAYASRVGEEGRGVATIIEMVNGTRLDCVTGSAALMRQAVSQAIHHCRYRRVFGVPLIDQPAMLNVLADLELETEAAALLMVRLATSFDRSADDEHERDLRRIATPLAKFWVTKRCSEVVHEALECLGGNGYVEESIMPRLFRESPLNAIWEGSGNVIALDVLRAATANPESIEALADDISLGSGFDARIEKAATAAISLLRNLSHPPAQARLVTARLATAWQASLLARFARPEVAEAFVRSRLAPEGSGVFGTLPADAALDLIVGPAIPRLVAD